MLVTLKTLAQATPQQVFDQVVTHLRAQQVPAKGPEGCAYRVGSLQCAAGCLIADDEYTDEMDQPGKDLQGKPAGSNWGSLIRRGVVPSTQHDSLIMDLQCIHDGFRGTPTWEAQFEEVARIRKLQYTPV